MPKIQKNFIKGRMNKSADERIVPQGEYIDALNVRLGSTEGTEIGAVENSKGNELLVTLRYNNQVLTGARCIGAYEDGANETIYWFVTSPSVDMIVSYNTKSFVLFYHVISTTLLNFDDKFLVNGINLIGDLLFFTDNLNAPRKINITRNYLRPIAGVDQITEQDIGVILAPPLNAPTIDQFKLGGGENFMDDLFLSFAYRWQYEDGEYSAISPFSQTAFSPGPFQIDYSTYDNSAMINSFNSVNIGFNTGGKNVKSVDLIFKFSTSQTINVIEKFNKVDQGWLDNESQTIPFTNKKIYTALPEEQLLRLYDNVPRKAQAQTIMGNRLMYGNYIDGYNITNENGKEIYLDYNIDLISETLSSKEIAATTSSVVYSIGPSETVEAAKISIDFGGNEIDLIQGSQIGINFNYRSSQYGGDASYDDGTQPENLFEYIFLFNIQQDYASVYALASSPEFIAAVQEFVAPIDSSCFEYQGVGGVSGTSVTDIYNCGILAKNNPEWQYEGFGVTNSSQGFQIETSQGSDVISITIPALKFQKYDTSVQPPTPLGVYAYEYLTSTTASGLYSLDSSKQSLHSNRDYEIAIVYMDDYGRSSTALVDTANTIYIPCENSITKNNIRVTLNNYAPYWATKYKFVIKESKTGYRTIYSNIFYTEASTGNVWFKLEGDNRDKVKNNENLFVKADTNGALLRCTKTKVLEFESKVEDFLCEKNADGEILEGSDACGQAAGTYMLLRPSGFAASAPENAFIEESDDCVGSYCTVKASAYIDNPIASDPGQLDFIPYTIPAGSIVNFTFNALRYKFSSSCGSRTYDYDKQFTATQDYDSLYDFVLGDNINLTNGISGGSDDTINTIVFDEQLYAFNVNPQPNPQPGVNTIFFQQDAADGRMFLCFRNGTPKCSGKNSYGSVGLEVQRATTLMIFETEPIQANDELYYENEQTFDIVDSFHQSGTSDTDQNQNLTQSAVIDLTFFNCYVFGNGVESDKVLDALVNPVLSLGDKVTSVSQEQFKESNRFGDITYSGVFNQESNLNKLNQFNLALANFKTLETSYGPIRTLHARQTDILTLQEDKISYVLVGKNLLSDAAAGGAITSVPEVLGTQLARIEEFGISNNPESFTSYGYDVYFTDAKRSSVINLKGGSKGGAGDKLSIISQVGMRSWFRDLFVDSFDTQKLGGFDPYMNEFVLSSNIQPIPTPPIERNCGYQLDVNNSSAPYIATIDFTTIIGDVTFDVANNSNSVNIEVTYDGTSVLDQVVASGGGQVTFNKPTSYPTTANVTITPVSGADSYSVVFNCPIANTLTVKQIVVNFEGEVSLTTTTRYKWSIGTDVSPYNTNSVVLEDDGVSLFQTQTGVESFGTIPANNSTVIMQSRQNAGQSYDFDPLTDKFKYLISNTNYEESDINTLLPLLNTATPITGGPLNYESSFSYSNNQGDDFLYLVWDLRDPTLISLCYSATTEVDACCDCGQEVEEVESCSPVEGWDDESVFLTGIADNRYFTLGQTLPGYGSFLNVDEMTSTNLRMNTESDATYSFEIWCSAQNISDDNTTALPEEPAEVVYTSGPVVGDTYTNVPFLQEFPSNAYTVVITSTSTILFSEITWRYRNPNGAAGLNIGDWDYTLNDYTHLPC